jgi:hypothetical protein
VRAAHLASEAIRLASIDQVLHKAHETRLVYHECRPYFGRGGKTLPADPRGSACEEWFHVMLRDAVAHNEPPDEDTPEWLAARYEARQRCSPESWLAAKGIVLPELPTGPVVG